LTLDSWLWTLPLALAATVIVFGAVFFAYKLHDWSTDEL
jgi:hypothetical protein